MRATYSYILNKKIVTNTEGIKGRRIYVAVSYTANMHRINLDIDVHSSTVLFIEKKYMKIQVLTDTETHVACNIMHKYY
jgi:hypothetical protein